MSFNNPEFGMKCKQIVKDLWGSSCSESVEFEDLVDFFRTATADQVLELENVCKKNNWDGFRHLIMKAGFPSETSQDLPPSSIDELPNYFRAANNNESKS